MKFALIGLAGMAGNMARRLRRQNIEVVGCDENAERVGQLAKECDVIVATSVVAALKKLPGDAPRVVWLMLPDSAAVDRETKNLANRLSPGDVVVDGGHSNYRDSQRRGALLSQSGIGFVDAGISDAGTVGDDSGLEQGFCITVGGERDHVKLVEPLLQALASASGSGWAHVGVAGAGHYVRMIQSGIELSVRQALSEGFAQLQGKANLSFDLPLIAQTWSQGAALGADLLVDEVTRFSSNGASSMVQSPDYDEVRWSVVEAIEQNLSVPVISAALTERYRRQND